MVFFLKFKTIGGLEFNDFLILFSIMTSVFGLLHVFFGGYNKIGIQIEEGKLDSHISCSQKIYFETFVLKYDDSSYLRYIFLIYTYEYDKMSKYNFNIKNTYIFFFGTITFLGFMMIFVSLSFFIGSSKSIVKGVFEAILGPTHYPPGIFEGTILKYIFMTVIPAFYIVFLPYNLIKSFSLTGFLTLLLSSIVFFGLGYFTFYKGLRRYESGNMVNMNV